MRFIYSQDMYHANSCALLLLTALVMRFSSQPTDPTGRGSTAPQEWGLQCLELLPLLQHQVYPCLQLELCAAGWKGGGKLDMTQHSQKLWLPHP